MDSSGIDIGNTFDFNLGSNLNSNNEWFHGKLDEVKVYNVKVSWL